MGELLALLYAVLSNHFIHYSHMIEGILAIKTTLYRIDDTYSKPVVIYSTENNDFTNIYLTCLITGRRLIIIDNSLSSNEALYYINLHKGILFISNQYYDKFDVLIREVHYKIHSEYIIKMNHKSNLKYECIYSIEDDDVNHITLLLNSSSANFKLDPINCINSLFTKDGDEDYPIVTTYSKSTKKLGHIDISVHTKHDLYKELLFYSKHIMCGRRLCFNINNSKYHVLSILYPIIVMTDKLNLKMPHYNNLSLEYDIIITTKGDADFKLREAKIRLLENVFFKMMYTYWPNSNYVLNRMKRAFLAMFSKRTEHVIIIGNSTHYLITSMIKKCKLPIDMISYSENRKSIAYVPYNEQVEYLNDEHFHFNHEVLYYSQIESALLELNLVEDAKVIKSNGETILLIKPAIDLSPEITMSDVEKVVEYYIKEINSNIKIFDEITRIVINPIPIPKDSEGEYLQYMYNLLDPHDN